MPSTDPINPQANRWLYRDESGKLHEIASPGFAGPPPKETTQAAKIQALARHIGVDPDLLAEKIPADTLRRLKYPVIEQAEPDGTASFQHDLGITEGERSLLGTDRAHAAIPPGSAPQPRASDGKFSH